MFLQATGYCPSSEIPSLASREPILANQEASLSRERSTAGDGQTVTGGSIIVRQRGTRHKSGLNVGRGKDDTLFAKITGKVKFINRGKFGRFVAIEATPQQATATS